MVQPGVANLDVTQAVAARASLRPRSVEPGRVHGRRQRRRELRRAALPQVRRHTNHMSALEVVLPDGSAVELGGRHGDPRGPTCRRVRRSEGMFGIATRITSARAHAVERADPARRLPHRPRGGRRGLGRSSPTGIVPAAMEMMDRPAMAAVEAVDRRRRLPHRRRRRAAGGARRRRERSRTTAADGRGICRERGAPRSARRRATPIARASGRAARRRSRAMGRIAPRPTPCRTRSCRAPVSPTSCDGSPRSATHHGLSVSNVFHAGDGNLHPYMLFDRRGRRAASGCTWPAEEILDACVDAGG